MDRREFTRLCSGLLAGAASLHASANGLNQPYPRSRLMFGDDTPITLDRLTVGSAHIFSYPYVTTPCFLLRLNQSANSSDGAWPGGVGDDQSVVAFSAICSHKMSHPAQPISHINYRTEAIRFRDHDDIEQQGEQLISCCSEHSVYDPASGAKVLSGPARQPLAAIALEIDDIGHLHAVGSLGPDQYERFLDKFGFRLALEYGISDVRARVGLQSVATAAADFSRQQIRC